jgi:hypothetical protein
LAENLKVTGTTNPEPNTCVDAHCNCDIIWSLAQQFAMRQLVTRTPAHGEVLDYREGNTHVSEEAFSKKEPPTFVSDRELRARRIAATYARVFLEDFHLGDKSKIGRFYWLGLGAFASKQVAATLNRWQVQAAHWSDLRAGLGLGNLWLFNDVLPWFYGYAAGADTFDKCANSRDSRHFVDQVATNFTRQLDHDTSIAKVPYEVDGVTGAKKAKLGYLKCTEIVKDGFKAVKDWETGSIQKRHDAALNHLLLIAQHEQGEVLQGLIYDNPDFQKWLDRQRAALATSDDTAINDSMNAMKYGLADDSSLAMIPFVRALVPGLHLVLTSQYKTNDIRYRSNAPDRMVLQNYRKRMDWIQKAADKYDDLMQTEKEFMLGELRAIQNFGDTVGSR